MDEGETGPVVTLDDEAEAAPVSLPQCMFCGRWLEGERAAASGEAEEQELARQVAKGICDPCAQKVESGEWTPLLLPDMSGFTAPVDRAWLTTMKHHLIFSVAFVRRMVELGHVGAASLAEADKMAAMAQALSSLLLMDSAELPGAMVQVNNAFVVRTHAPGSDEDGDVVLIQGGEGVRRSYEGPINGAPGGGWNSTHDVFYRPRGTGSPAAEAGR